MFLYSIQEITPFPDFELLDTRIASALNKIIPNSYFRNEVSQEEQKAQKQDRFLQGRQIAHLIYDYVPVTGVNDSVLYYSDLFSVVLRNNNIQESDTRWDEMLLSMEQLNLEIHQQKAKPDYHRMKTMVKRSIEQNLRSRNLGARNGRIESNILVKNQREQRRVHKGQGNCWQWQASGQCSKGDQCSFWHDRNKRAKVTTQPTPSPEQTTQTQGVKDFGEIQKSQEGKSVWENISSAVQGSSERYLYESIL